jgi:hypothetical protein
MKHFKLITTVAVAAIGLNACTKLDETLRDSLDFASENVTAAGLLQSAYESFNNPIQDQSRFWAAQQHTSDETIGPTRGPDWDDNGVWRVMHTHKWNADHGFLRDTYRELLQAQFAASTVLEKSPTPQQAAEARFLRAFSMWCVLDGWDQVPYRSDLKDLKKTPETLKGTAAADFILSECNAILASLPENPGSGVQPWKVTKDAVRALMMKTLLNKAVYANRKSPSFNAADMNQVITLADQIMANNKYSLTPEYFENFSKDNTTKSKELIWVLENTRGVRTGNMQSRWYMGLHYNQRPSGWNGFTTLSDFYDKFTDPNDRRRGGTYPGVTDVSGLRVGFLVGQQFDQNGVALKDRTGAPLAFTREVKLQESGSNLEVTGIRVVKYPPDFSEPAENEYVIFRLADVMLMKAEAILRGGTATGGQTPLSIVNAIRARSGAAALGSVTLDALLDERGRELYFEGWRRNDLIRFGKFLAAWQEKPASTDAALLFPIPNEQLSVNPNLTQNPGY